MTRPLLDRPVLSGPLPVLLIAWALLAWGSPAGAQAEEPVPEEDPAASSEAAPAAADPMAPLGDMVGTWKGEGWIRRGPGEPAHFDSTEIVRGLLDGEALLIEGIHRSRSTGAVSHHAIALLSWDADEEIYRFRSHVAGRGPGDFEGYLEDGVFVWGGPAGPGEMRYRITIQHDSWREIGEYSRDGETWNQFFEMTLERRDGP